MEGCEVLLLESLCQKGAVLCGAHSDGVRWRVERIVRRGGVEVSQEQLEALVRLVGPRNASLGERDELAVREDWFEMLPAHVRARPMEADPCDCGWRGLGVPWIGCKACRTGWWALGVVP